MNGNQERTLEVLDLNTSTLAIFQAIDFERLGGDYRDFKTVCQHLLEVNEKERDVLLKGFRIDNTLKEETLKNEVTN